MTVHVYLSIRSERTRWLERSIASAIHPIRTDEEARRVPSGAVWLCAVEDQDRLRGLRGAADTIVSLRPETHPWHALAHDLRGPLMVIEGAMQLQQGRLQDLALRGIHQLCHTAECWDALALPCAPASVRLADVVRQACRMFVGLEPRAEAPSVDVGEIELVTDAKRLTLGLVRLVSHLTRLSPGGIRLCTDAAGTLELRAGGPIGDHVSWDARCAPELWRRSSRLALAVLLLDPLTERWEIEGDVARWYPVAREARETPERSALG